MNKRERLTGWIESLRWDYFDREAIIDYMLIMIKEGMTTKQIYCMIDILKSIDENKEVYYED